MARRQNNSELMILERPFRMMNIRLISEDTEEALALVHVIPTPSNPEERRKRDREASEE